MASSVRIPTISSISRSKPSVQSSTRNKIDLPNPSNSSNSSNSSTVKDQISTSSTSSDSKNVKIKIREITDLKSFNPSNIIFEDYSEVDIITKDSNSNSNSNNSNSNSNSGKDNKTGKAPRIPIKYHYSNGEESKNSYFRFMTDRFDFTPIKADRFGGLGIQDDVIFLNLNSTDKKDSETLNFFKNLQDYIVDNLIENANNIPPIKSLLDSQQIIIDSFKEQIEEAVKSGNNIMADKLRENIKKISKGAVEGNFKKFFFQRKTKDKELIPNAFSMRLELKSYNDWSKGVTLPITEFKDITGRKYTWDEVRGKDINGQLIFQFQHINLSSATHKSIVFMLKGVLIHSIAEKQYSNIVDNALEYVAEEGGIEEDNIAKLMQQRAILDAKIEAAKMGTVNVTSNITGQNTSSGIGYTSTGPHQYSEDDTDVIDYSNITSLS